MKNDFNNVLGKLCTGVWKKYTAGYLANLLLHMMVMLMIQSDLLVNLHGISPIIWRLRIINRVTM